MALFCRASLYCRDVSNGLSGATFKEIFLPLSGNKRYLERARMVGRVSGGVTRHWHSTKGNKITMRKYLKTLSRYSSLINTAMFAQWLNLLFQSLEMTAGELEGTWLCFSALALPTCFDGEMCMKSGGWYSAWELWLVSEPTSTTWAWDAEC